jgi:hypothetical protein
MTSSADQSYQQWDYRCLTWTNEDLKTLRDGITETSKELGKQGWEMVNASLTRTEIGSRPTGGGTMLTIEYSIICFFKRPIG